MNSFIPPRWKEEEEEEEDLVAWSFRMAIQIVKFMIDQVISNLGIDLIFYDYWRQRNERERKRDRRRRQFNQETREAF